MTNPGATIAEPVSTPGTSRLSNPGQPEQPHWAALDGVRAIAFIAVVIFHTVGFWDIDGLSGALRYACRVGRSMWMGVDLFFVLSGFLITGILLNSKAAPNYFARFYVRRSLRIFPLYYLFLCALTVWLFVSTQDTAQITAIGRLSYWFYLQNVWVAVFSWDAFRPLNHLWSLANEEQFYLVWPAVIFLVPARRLRVLGMSLVVTALVLRVAMLHVGDWGGAVYVLTPCRMDCLVMGALLAIFARDAAGRQWLRVAGPPALLASGLMMGLLFAWRHGYEVRDPVVQTIGYSLNAVFFSALLATVMFGRRATRARSLLSNATLGWIGRRSYAGYLFHAPVGLIVQAAIISRVGSPATGMALTLVLTLAVSLLAAEVSWQWFESYWLGLRESFDARLAARSSMPTSVAS
jgi:peptidoglycan/LPS O-acetylase OafA/YrhL